MSKDAGDILRRAALIVEGDRAESHGDARECLQATAELWGALLSLMGKAPAKPLEARDVAILMGGLKVARMYRGKESSNDNYVDLAGYAALAGAVSGVDKVKPTLGAWTTYATVPSQVSSAIFSDKAV